MLLFACFIFFHTTPVVADCRSYDDADAARVMFDPTMSAFYGAALVDNSRYVDYTEMMPFECDSSARMRDTAAACFVLLRSTREF